MTLCHRNRDGSHTRQADPRQTVTLISRQSRDAGFRHMTAGEPRRNTGRTEAALDRAEYKRPADACRAERSRCSLCMSSSVSRVVIAIAASAGCNGSDDMRNRRTLLRCAA